MRQRRQAERRLASLTTIPSENERRRGRREREKTLAPFSPLTKGPCFELRFESWTMRASRGQQDAHRRQKKKDDELEAYKGKESGFVDERVVDLLLANVYRLSLRRTPSSTSTLSPIRAFRRREAQIKQPNSVFLPTFSPPVSLARRRVENTNVLQCRYIRMMMQI
jgi:hypothetical protein